MNGNTTNDKIYIVGSCSIENRDFYLKLGNDLNGLLEGKNFIYKASFDKANRSSISGNRGVGLEEGIKIFKEMKEINPNLRLTTDIHEVHQIEKLAGIIDVIQIPAFLCRQTDLLVESAKHFDVVNIKKGQWVSPENLLQGVDKIKSTNPDCQAWATERGTQVGYGKLMVDFSAVDIMKQGFDKVILDCTHSTQGFKANGRVEGNVALAERYIQAADIFQYDGIFAETHYTPEIADSDRDSQLPFDVIKKYL
jgi:2-dehydro-3-deoxyphosphooctonate aldolase (KDO 8-P synthase)